MKSWMLYGAYGFTGKLIAQEAKLRGHSPVLAGRSEEKLIPVAEDLDLEYLVLDLSNIDILTDTVKNFDLIFHSAGPYKYTSAPMVQACLKSNTNYVDITGEISVFEQNFKFDNQARDKKIAIISGVGFDVVPTDCLAKYVSKKISQPTSLDLGIVAMSNPSPGTLKTMFEHYDIGQLVRRNGILIPLQEQDVRKIQFSDIERTVRPVTWGDLSTAYRSTGIPNITTYFPLPKKFPNLLKSLGISAKEMAKDQEAKRKVYNWIEENIHGPDKHKQETLKTYIWASVHNEEGQQAQAWLETIESYRFTAVAGVRCVEKIFEIQPTGAITPAMAFGADLVLELPRTVRLDSIA
jgi:short subunit dehydrogenase-like uncharacterized protein